MASSTTIPRDPSHYYPSTHAKQQRKWRGLSWDQVVDAIENGDVRPSNEKDTYIFEGLGEDGVSVVARITDGKIATVVPGKYDPSKKYDRTHQRTPH